MLTNCKRYTVFAARPGTTMPEPDFEPDRRRVECIHIGAAEIRRGDRVRLRPTRQADILDMALVGKTATVEAIEQDYEDRVHLAVTVDDDPGQDLGAAGQPGHRFFFRPEELEPIEGEERGSP